MKNSKEKAPDSLILTAVRWLIDSQMENKHQVFSSVAATDVNRTASSKFAASPLFMAQIQKCQPVVNVVLFFLEVNFFTNLETFFFFFFTSLI